MNTEENPQAVSEETTRQVEQTAQQVEQAAQQVQSTAAHQAEQAAAANTPGGGETFLGLSTADLYAFLINLGTALLILIIGVLIAGWLTRLFRGILGKRQLDATLISFTGSIFKALLVIMVIIAAAGRLGIPTAQFVAVLGAAGLAIGLALQGSLSNFASGFLIILLKPFKAGEFVEAGGTMGIVEEITLFTTSMRTPDNKSVIVPNGQITSATITNYSARDTRRMDLTFGVSYNDDLEKVKAVAMDVLKNDKRILEDPAPTVGVLELADSAVVFAVRPWVKTAEYWDVFWDLQMTMKQRFDAEGITIPFPQRDMHFFPAEGTLPIKQVS